MRFAVDHPNVRIDVESGIDRDFSAALHRGELDMAISGQLDGQVDRILLDQLVVEEWGVVGCATNARLTEAKELKDLLGMQWIIGRNTTALDIRIAETFADAGMPPPRPGIMTTSVLFTLNALRHSDYLAILPQSLCQTIDGLQWRNMSEGAWNTPIYLMRRKRALTDDLLRAALRVFNVAT
jgi:DNA-binding transcriptional LysR family regulator